MSHMTSKGFVRLDQPSPSRGSKRPGSVARRIQEELRRSPYSCIRQLQCDYHEGVVTLRGRVPSYYLKQLAQSIARRTDGVEEVADRIDVASVK